MISGATASSTANQSTPRPSAFEFMNAPNSQPARQPGSGEWAGDGPPGAWRCSHRVYTHRPEALYASFIFLEGCEL